MNKFGSSVNSITSLVGVNNFLALTRTSAMYKAENSNRSMTADFNREDLIPNCTKMTIKNYKYPQNSFGFYLKNEGINSVIANIQKEQNRTESRILELD